MKIISGGKKDYYDYLVSLYGIDEDIVYDRRESVVMRPYQKGWVYFVKEKRWDDKPQEPKRMWHTDASGKEVFGLVTVGALHHFVLEVGQEHYLFKVERFVRENDEVIIRPQLLRKIEHEKMSKHVISIIPCDVGLGYWGAHSQSISYRLKEEIPEVILSSTFIPSFISPEEIYDNVYNYLISIREKPIIDKRDDVLKLESFGFDKKTSFRNPIYCANNKKHRAK